MIEQKKSDKLCFKWDEGAKHEEINQTKSFDYREKIWKNMHDLII